MSEIVRLSCKVQNYAWGKPAEESLVAEFTNNSGGSERYAELWMGTHPRGHSTLQGSGVELATWIREDLQVRLGTADNNTGNLPFLLKILSVDKALSIQVHPTKEHATELHNTAPHLYPDPNHKPEMAIALTQFEGLCGFRPVCEIIDNMRSHDELHSHLSKEIVDIIINNTASVSDESSFIKKLFTELIMLEKSAELIKEKVESKGVLSESDKLFMRISSQHPGDRGLVCIYLLNHVILQPGECMFLGANKIHAYFSGDCVECMASSDNVVRAGLTPKFVDVDTLLGMLDCRPGTAASQKLHSVSEGGITKYLPPVPDFAVERIHCENNTLTLPPKNSPQIIICTEGTGNLVTRSSNLVTNSSTDSCNVKLERGDVVFVVPEVSLSVSGNLVLFSAYSQA